MTTLAAKYKIFAGNRELWTSAFLSIVLLAISLVVNFYAGIYASEKASSPVTDIILSNIRVFDVDGIFVYGPIFLWTLVAVLCLFEPRRIPFTLKSIALFVLIRAVFVNLTHIGPFPDQLAIDYTSDFVKRFTFAGDLFFSAHTGLPFLMSLVFGQDIRLRILFIAAAIFFGIIVLLAHLHYTIDVVSAFFITYTIYRLSEFFFKKDRKLFLAE